MDEWVFRRDVCGITHYCSSYYTSISPQLGYFVYLSPSTEIIP